MNITINGETIDYSLEEEENLSDVIDGISDWLKEAAMLIQSVDIDGVPADLTENEWRKKNLESIEDLKITALSLQEARIIQLQTAGDYFTLLQKALENSDESALMELSDAYEDIKGMLPHLLESNSHASRIGQLDEVLSQIGFPMYSRSLDDTKQKNHNDVKENFSTLISPLLSELSIRQEEISNPLACLSKSADKLSEIAGQLDDVAVHLQTGKDKKAMTIIITLTDHLQTFHRVLKWLSAKEGIAKMTEGFNDILIELEEALKVNDTVLIGDLLEYELKPRLSALPQKLQDFGKVET